MRRFLPFLLLLTLCLPVWAVEISAGASLPAQRMRLRDDVSVIVGYVHSVELTWVEETYVVDSDGLRLARMRWQSSGAGLPDEYDSYAEGFYVRELDIDIGRVLDYWFIPLNRVEISVDGAVVFRGPDLPTRVVVRVRRVPVAVSILDSVGARLASRRN
jgi:hypothetical protein